MTSLSTKNVDLNIKHDFPLSQVTTFRLGGNAKTFIQCQTPQELLRAIQYVHDLNKPFILMGGGSNLVISDHGVADVVIRFVSDTPLIKVQEDKCISVSASTSLDALVKFSAEHGLKGINYASGIPGTVGGAIVGNAGAFGRQIGDVIREVILISPSGQRRSVRADKLEFNYRHSALKSSNDIVSEAILTLIPGNKDALQKERADILAIRADKHPNLNQNPCAGSFFRNIEPTSKADRRQAAGWFLEQAGGKTLKSGGAQIYAKHANIIVKAENCTAQDVFELSKSMQSLVKDKFNLDLIREVRFVGNFRGKPNHIVQTIW